MDGQTPDKRDASAKTSGKVHVTVACDDWPPFDGPNPDDTPVEFHRRFLNMPMRFKVEFDFGGHDAVSAHTKWPTAWR